MEKSNQDTITTESTDIYVFLISFFFVFCAFCGSPFRL